MCHTCNERAHALFATADWLDAWAAEEDDRELADTFIQRAEFFREMAEEHDHTLVIEKKNLRIEKPCSGKSYSPLLSGCLKARRRSISAKTSRA